MGKGPKGHDRLSYIRSLGFDSSASERRAALRRIAVHQRCRQWSPHRMVTGRRSGDRIAGASKSLTRGAATISGVVTEAGTATRRSLQPIRMAVGSAAFWAHASVAVVQRCRCVARGRQLWRPVIVKRKRAAGTVSVHGDNEPSTSAAGMSPNGTAEDLTALQYRTTLRAMVLQSTRTMLPLGVQGVVHRVLHRFQATQGRTAGRAAAV